MTLYPITQNEDFLLPFLKVPFYMSQKDGLQPITYGHMRKMNENRLELKVWKWALQQRSKRGRSRKT